MTTTETFPAITYAVGDRVMVNYSQPGRPAHDAWSGPATVDLPQRTPGSLVVVKTDTGFTGVFRPDAVSPLYTSTTAEDFEGIDALPVGIVVQDRDGDIFQRAEDGRFVLIDGSESSFNFQPGQYDAFSDEISQVPLTVLNPELLDELILGDYRVGDRVRIVSDIFRHRVPVGAPGTVLGPEVDLFVEVRFDADDLRTYPCALNEIEPYTEVEVDPYVPLADWERALLASSSPTFAVGDRVIVSADATTVTGGPVYFDGAVRATVVEDMDSEGDLEVETEEGFSQDVAPQFLRLDTEPEIVPDAELIGATVEDAETLDSLPNGTVLTDSSPISYASRVKVGNNWHYLVGGVADYSTSGPVVRRGGLTVAYLPAV